MTNIHARPYTASDPLTVNRLRAPPQVINITIACAPGCPGGTSCVCVTLLHLPSTTCSCTACTDLVAILTGRPAGRVYFDPPVHCAATNPASPPPGEAPSEVPAAPKQRQVAQCRECEGSLGENCFASKWSEIGQRPDPICTACLDRLGYTFEMVHAEGKAHETEPWWFSMEEDSGWAVCADCDMTTSVSSECFDESAGWCCEHCREARIRCYRGESTFEEEGYSSDGGPECSLPDGYESDTSSASCPRFSLGSCSDEGGYGSEGSC